MTPEFINGWWLSTDIHLGVSAGGYSDMQRYNAHKVKNALSAAGWTLNAICGTLGNMQCESFMSPAYIQATNRWRLPNNAASLSDVPNSVMENFYREYYGDPNRNYGIGLVQWDGKGITRQKLVGYAENNGWDWFDGDTQTSRILYEQTNNMQWQSTVTIDGVAYNWSTYPTGTAIPENMAEAWRAGYEVGGDDTVIERQENARRWYNYFITDPPMPPTPTPGLPSWMYFVYNNNKRKVVKNVRIQCKSN